MHEPPHNRVLLQELDNVSNSWMRGGKQQWGFIQGRFDQAYLDEGPLYVVRNEGGAVVAFANGADPYVPGQATIDLMRYTPEAPSNTMDYLLLQTLRHCWEQGNATFNLGLAPLTSSPDSEPASAEERIVQQIAKLNQDFLAVEGLRQFKNKFEPEWNSQYLVYLGLPTNLVRIALALARATKL